MRQNLLHGWYKELSYEIREIVDVARKIESFWKQISWENIGDPIEKWEQVPVWMKKIITDALQNNEVYGYSPSRWLEKTREYLAKKSGKISKDDIIFFNGLWEAINKTYGYLAWSARVIGPSPAYPTHSSAEATNSWSEHITYSLDPNNDWNPDIEEMENKIKYNPNVAGILVINPDNPTWAVFKREVLEQIVDIAKRYDLFLIFDEIYEKLVYDEKDKVMLSDIIGDVPGISMKGISKDVPWPGSRCGWMEIYNQDKDENFRKYVHSIFLTKMLEVCSTTLPQYVLPIIYEDSHFAPYIKTRIEKYKNRADIAEEILWDLEEITFIKPKWAFYLSIIFNRDTINMDFKNSYSHPELQQYVDTITTWVHFSKKFCYELLAETGICTVPLSWFNTDLEGFRITLLEENIEKYRRNFESIRAFILKYKK